MFRSVSLALLVGCVLTAPGFAQTAVVPSEAQLRLDEIRIELAWNADPLTFPYSLVAVADGPTLKVYGGVPNNVVATQALKTAREITSVKVQDALTVRTSLTAVLGPQSAFALETAAEFALKQAFPTRAQNLTVKADAKGRLTVTGSLSSYEECRAVCRRLKQLPGCTSIASQVQVAAVSHQGQTCHRVTSDGRLFVAAPSEPAKPGDAPSGIVQAGFHSEDKSPPNTQASPLTPPAGSSQLSLKSQFSSWQIKRCVEKACGMAAKQVQVLPASGGGLQVRVKARSEDEGQRLFEKLVRLPELAPYQLQFHIQVER